MRRTKGRHHEHTRSRRPARGARRHADDREEPDRRRVERAVRLRGLGRSRRDRAHGKRPARRRRPVGHARHERRHRRRDGGPRCRAALVDDRRRASPSTRPTAGRSPTSRRRCRSRRCRRRCSRWATSARTRWRSCRAPSCSTTTAICATTSSSPTARSTGPSRRVTTCASRRRSSGCSPGCRGCARTQLAFVDRPDHARAHRSGRRHVVDRTRRRRRPRARERRRGARFGRDGHVRRARLRGVGHATPAVEVDDERSPATPTTPAASSTASRSSDRVARPVSFASPRSPAPTTRRARAPARVRPVAARASCRHRRRAERRRAALDSRRQAAPDHRRDQPPRAHGVALGRGSLPRLGVPGARRRVRDLGAT